MKKFIKKILAELSKRNIYRVVAAYGLFAYTFAHIGYILTNSFNSPKWVMKYAIGLLALGFLVIILFQWFYKWTGTGFHRRNNESGKSKRTCLYTDIEGSTHLALTLGDSYLKVLEEHRSLIHDIVKRHNSKSIEYIGDCSFVIFDSVIDALVSSSLIMKSFDNDYWKNQLGFRIKIGINTGYYSSEHVSCTETEVIKTSIITRIATGQKVLMSSNTYEESPKNLPEGLSIINHGLYTFKDLQVEDNIYELIIDGLSSKQFQSSTITKKKLLVLPFDRFNSDEFNCLFCDGMTEELIVMLSQIPQLSVYSRSVSFSFKDLSGNLNNAIIEQGADLAVCGSVRVLNDNIKVMVELINPKSNRILWSGIFKRKISDVFELQEEITRNIVDTLNINFGEKKNGKKYMSNKASANVYFMRARHLYYNYNKGSIFDALKYYQKAIDIDSDFALSYVGVAKCFLLIYQIAGGEKKYLEEANKFCNKAINLAPFLSVARTVKGMVQMGYLQYAAASKSFSKALELDPHSFIAWYKYGKLSYLMGDYEQAGRLFEHAAHCRVEDYQSLFYLGQIYEELKHYKLAEIKRKNAIKLIVTALKINYFDRRALYIGAICKASLGESLKAIEWINRALKQNNEDPLTLYAAASMYAVLNDTDKAISFLRKAMKQGFNNYELISKDMNLKNIRSEINSMISEGRNISDNTLINN